MTDRERRAEEYAKLTKHVKCSKKHVWLDGFDAGAESRQCSGNKTEAHVITLEAKLKIAREALEYYSSGNKLKYFITGELNEGIADHALSKIGETHE